MGVDFGRAAFAANLMLKAILLIVRSAPTWEGIVEARRGVLGVTFLFLLPLLLLSSAGESYGLMHWGKQRGEFGKPLTITQESAVRYGAVNFAAGLASVFAASAIVLSIGKNLRGRQMFVQAFQLCAYGLSPYFTARLLNGLPFMPLTVVWAVGVVLACAVIYLGIPRVMQPDPPQAFSLYLLSVMTFVSVTLLVHLLTRMMLEQEFQIAQQLIKISPHHH